MFFGTFIILGSDALHRLGKLADMPCATVRRAEMVRIKKPALIRFDSAVPKLDLYIPTVRNFEKQIIARIDEADLFRLTDGSLVIYGHNAALISENISHQRSSRLLRFF